MVRRNDIEINNWHAMENLEEYLEELARAIKPMDVFELFQHPELLSHLEQAHSTFDWETLERILQLINRLPEKEQRLVAMKSSKVCWKLISREFQRERTVIWTRWLRVLAKISCKI